LRVEKNNVEILHFVQNDRGIVKLQKAGLCGLKLIFRSSLSQPERDSPLTMKSNLPRQTCLPPRAAVRQGGRKPSRAQSRRSLAGYCFISPWILGFILFTGGPIVASFLLSFCRWDGISEFKNIRWIGLENYKTLLGFVVREGSAAPRDPLFWQSLKVTFAYSIISVPLGIIAALITALLMNQRLRGIGVYRTIFYLPVVTSGVATALLWRWIFNSRYGLLNLALRKIGIAGPLWFESPSWALPAFIIMSLWGIGNAMIINLAGLQGIPRQLYEAAEIDGAGWLRKFRYVTLPMLSPVIFFNLIMGTIYSFQVFTQALIITNGGPGHATLFYVLYLYRNAFVFFKMGYAAAMAWILFLIIFAITLLNFRAAKKWVYYHGEGI
jgi:multiple sugar transport system permease protein